jgi:O-antigen biosynthesis protein
MKVSIFTPTHNPKYLGELFDSIVRQQYTDWEWIIAPNHGAEARIPDEIRSHPKVSIHVPPEEMAIGVGALKRYATYQATGDVLAEVDHDDILTPDCLQEVVGAFKTSNAGMVYSNAVEITEDWKCHLYNKAFGWQYRPFLWNGRELMETVSPEAIPQNIARIWFAPNHIRAWDRRVYNDIGGHNIGLKVGDDHDLICRTYLKSKIVHIDKPLYIYRVIQNGTWKTNVQAIQDTMWTNYHKYVEPMAIKWARDNSLQVIDLCGGMNKPVEYTSVDILGADITANLEEPWPFEDNSVGVLRASDAVEHLKDPIHTMNEAHRVLAHGGFFLISVPSTKGEGAWSDPTHKSYWNKRSFRYYTDGRIGRFLQPHCSARFQVLSLRDINKWDDHVPYVEAELLALKDESIRFHGERLI